MQNVTIEAFDRAFSDRRTSIAAPAHRPTDAEVIQAALLAPAPRPRNVRLARALAFAHAYRTDPKVPRLLRMHLYDCLVRPVVNFF